ncbi:hypothetical protein H0H92_013604 [Tricholoma furcatifolium]|nr:hypothetical protein H0H92_013604 [Tricholoma furcatifolium]
MPLFRRTRKRRPYPPRGRRRFVDMQLNSDVDIETDVPIAPPTRIQRRGAYNDNDSEDEAEGEGSDVDVEAVAEGEEEQEEDGAEGEEDEEDEEDDDGEEEEEENQSDADDIPKPSASRLKIRLKMPKHSSSRYETPVVESEDSTDSFQPSSRPLTTRQAVLANVVDSSHVSLDSSRQKKAPLNDMELALRREEIARKRRHLTEKKLQDEKLETINRLLKKQSRPRKKRNNAQRADMDDILPADTRSNSNGVQTPRGPKPKKSAAAGDEGPDVEDGEDEDGMEEADDVEEMIQPEREVQLPTMYRWISTSRIPSALEEGANKDTATTAASADASMQITFSVPMAALPPVPLSEAQTPALGIPVPKPVTCSAPGCGKPFKYRLVKDWTRGACGMSCLKALETAMDVNP